MRDIVQSMWVGPELSLMEQLCIRSFLANGHPFHLYVYQETKGIPEGTTVLDGNDILSSSVGLSYHGEYLTGKGTFGVGHPAAFSDVFRYQLIRTRGGWWVDTDLVCLRPFDFQTDYVFSSQEDVVNIGAIRSSAGSPVMNWLCEQCASLGKLNMPWGELGPKLMARAVYLFGLRSFVQPAHTFCPVADWSTLLDPSGVTVTAPDPNHRVGQAHRRVRVAPCMDSFGPETYGIHLWNAMWYNANRSRSARYHPDCLYEQLLKHYVVR